MGKKGVMEFSIYSNEFTVALDNSRIEFVRCRMLIRGIALMYFGGASGILSILILLP